MVGKVPYLSSFIHVHWIVCSTRVVQMDCIGNGGKIKLPNEKGNKTQTKEEEEEGGRKENWVRKTNHWYVGKSKPKRKKGKNKKQKKERRKESSYN